MDTITTRPADDAEVGWLTDVFLCSLRDAITATRGVWDEPRERVQFNEQLDLANTRIIQRRGTDVGFLISRDHGADVELHTLCIVGEYQSRGIGTYVTRRLISDARAAGRGVVLSVLKVNERARRLYERLGFVSVDESTHHYRMRLR
jgi:ribosomal protein S18 acetylase RimI-like enzyme